MRTIKAAATTVFAAIALPLLATAAHADDTPWQPNPVTAVVADDTPWHPNPVATNDGDDTPWKPAATDDDTPWKPTGV